MSLLLSLLVAPAQAESAIEFKTTSPVAIVVDGKQASITSNMRQRLGGLEPGVHQLQVNGVFGKTLYEAEIDLPDNTLTIAEWVRGELRVVKTEWLEAAAEEPVAAEAPAAPEETAPDAVDVVAPVAPVVAEVPEVAAPAVPAVAAPPVVSAPVAPPIAPPVVAVAPIAVPTEAAAPKAVAPVAATAMPAAVRPRTLTVQATDGMQIEVNYQGRVLRVIVDGDTFRIEDPTGAVLALGSN